jgi:hypothetical protein
MEISKDPVVATINNIPKVKASTAGIAAFTEYMMKTLSTSGKAEMAFLHKKITQQQAAGMNNEDSPTAFSEEALAARKTRAETQWKALSTMQKRLMDQAGGKTAFATSQELVEGRATSALRATLSSLWLAGLTGIDLRNKIGPGKAVHPLDPRTRGDLQNASTSVPRFLHPRRDASWAHPFRVQAGPRDGPRCQSHRRHPAQGR